MNHHTIIGIGVVIGLVLVAIWAAAVMFNLAAMGGLL